MSMKKFREALRNGEALAIKHNPNDAKRSRADILDMLFGEPVRPNEYREECTIMYIHGPLEQRDCGYGDSYELIRKRFGEALAAKPECIVIRIDSPGGVVAGLNQCVYDMIRAKKANGKHVIVYVDELMASAAYAIGGGVADEVFIPPSGITGSIGVISTMFDTTGADEKAGFNFVTITSGDRKADGHPHQPLEDAAVAAERDRVEKLAAQFFRIVKRSRGVDAAPLQAGLFLGKDAVKAGLADDVMGWERLLVDVKEVYGSGNGTSATAQNGTQEADMLKLKAMIKRVSAQLAEEKDANKRAKLAAQLGAFQATLVAMKKTYKKVSEEETEESDDHEDEEESEEGNETDREEDDMPGDDPDKDKDKDEEDEEEEEASAASEEEEEDETPPKKDGKKAKKSASEEEEEDETPEDKEAFSSPGKRAALLAKARAFDVMQSDVATLKKKSVKDERASVIKQAREANRITAKHAKMLATKKLSFVKDFLALHTTPMVFSGEEPGSIPDDTGPRMGANGDIPRDIMKQFEAASQASKGAVTVDQLVADYKKSLNGGASR